MSIAPQRGIGDVVRCAFVFQTRWVVVPLLRGEGDNPVHPVHLGHPDSDKQRAADWCSQPWRGPVPRPTIKVKATVARGNLSPARFFLQLTPTRVIISYITH